jgi:hypothetical protein
MGLDQYLQQRKLGETEAEIIGTWRKANQIHRWFKVHKTNGEEINCDPVEVTVNDLLKLKMDCREVIGNHELAPVILPTENGFFFGGTDYDQYYFEDLEQTINIIDKVNFEAGPVFYDAWW